MKKILVVGSMFLCIGLLVSIKNKDDNQDDILLKDNISINESNTIAMYKSDDKTNYTTITEMPESGYTINEDKSYCTTNNKTPDTTSKLKTIEGNHVVTGLKKNSKCYIWFDKYIKPVTSEEILAKFNIISKDGTPDFSKTATTDEGVYKVADGMYGGNSYYWRGLVINNHVIFANKCWRVVRINGDGTIRLIYNGNVKSENTCTGNGANSESIVLTNQKYNVNFNSSEDVGWTSSNAKTQTENWYNSNIIGTDAEKVADGKFCNDRVEGVVSSFSFNFAAYARIYETYLPTLACSTDDVYIVKAGLITADEVMYAGGNENSNSSYYLYNGQNYWTMSPSYYYYNTSTSDAGVFYVRGNGKIGDVGVGSSTSYGIRPVINLNSNVTFNAGSDGTQNNPYVVQ